MAKHALMIGMSFRHILSTRARMSCTFLNRELRQNGSSYHDASLTITAHGPDLLIRGTNLAGAAWNARLLVNGLSCLIFQADLDNNGQRDLIVYAPGISDLGAYGTSVSILLFDDAGSMK
jgi:hypothetical protein